MNRKDQIIQVVINILKQNALTDISLTSIAKEVNIGKSTIYEYFSSKEELLKEALFAFVEETINTVTLDEDITQFTFEDLFKEQMRRLLKAASTSRIILETLQPKFAAQFSEETRNEMKQTVENIRDKISKRFYTFFEKGIAEGVVSSNMTPLDGYIVTSLVVGTIFTYTDPKMELDVEVVNNKLYDSMLKLIN